MKIIQADLSDPVHLEAVLSLFQEYFEYGNALSMAAAGITFSINSREELLASLKKFIPQNRGNLFLIAIDQSIVGMGAYRDLGDHRSEMKRVFLRPPVRGKGFGRTLVQRLIEDARGKGFSSMVLESGTYMPEARKLYESLGFQEILPYCGSECGTENLPCLYYMSKEL